MWGSSGHGTKQIAGVNFAIGVCARLNIRNMIPVLSLGVYPECSANPELVFRHLHLNYPFLQKVP